MSADIIAPNLPNWVQRGITAIYTATTDEEFDKAFDGVVAQKVSITVNGKNMSRDQYKTLIRSETNGGSGGASVSFTGIVAVPSESKDLRANGTGAAGALFTATLKGPHLVLGQNFTTVTSCMNVVVISDPTIHHPHQVGHGSPFDPRRISSIDEVRTDELSRISVPPLKPPTAV